MKLKFQHFFVVLLLLAGIGTAAAQGTAFTYQGRLNDNGAPANGNYDFRFILFNVQEFGFPVGPILTNSNLSVSNGIFTTSLDFGSGVFTGTNYWLEISVRANGGAFNTLLPRQSITPTPYATFAASAASAESVAGQISVSQLNGTLSNAQLANNSITVNAGNGLSGGGSVALGNAITLNNTGVLSVTGNPDVIATTNNGAVQLSLNADPYISNNSIVRRSFSGEIYAAAIRLPSSSQGTPAIYSGTYPVFLFDNKGNSLIGTSAGETMTTGQGNIANGAQTLLKNTSGSGNVAIGAYAMGGNTTGSYNIAVGQAALGSMTTAGNDNVGIGITALYLATNSYNTAVGSSALHENVSGQRNIGLGYMAGYYLTGSDNICIGNLGTAGNERTIRIGSNQTNTFISGIRGTTISGGTAVYISASGQLGIASSSARFKKDIQDMNDASDALLSLRPVTFRYKPEIDPAGLPQFGLIAEEVDKVNPDLVVRDENGQVYTVRYEAINAMLLNEFLKQHRTVEQQNVEIQTLKAKSDALETRLSELEQAMKSLAEK